MNICKLIENCKNVNQEELSKMFTGLISRDNNIIEHYQSYCIKNGFGCVYNNVEVSK